MLTPGGDRALEHEESGDDQVDPKPVVEDGDPILTEASVTTAVVVRAAAPVPARQEARENGDTPTPSTRTPSQADSNEDKDRLDDLPSEAPQSQQCSARSNPPPFTTTVGKSVEETSDSPSLQTEGLAALVPHQSKTVVRGASGPRPAPTLGAQCSVAQGQLVFSSGSSSSREAEPRSTQVQNPLGSLCAWLDDADVGDVLDQFTLDELVQMPSSPSYPSGSAPAMASDQASVEVSAYKAHKDAAFAMQRCENRGTESGDGLDDSDDEEDHAFEPLPSDKEVLPRAPPLAPSALPLMRPLSPPTSPRDAQRTTGYGSPNGVSMEPNEEEEWLARQRLTGAIGRLVRYTEADVTPKDDILGFRTTRRGRIMVTAVREMGIAARAGVSAGDELVSIDGRKEFVGHQAHVVHASLCAPVTLVFLGFVGKLQAEVRVKRPPEPKCGLAINTEVVVNSMDQQLPPVELCDAVIFQPSSPHQSTLLITAGSNGVQEPPTSAPEECSTIAQELTEDTPSPKTIMYEIQREDAKNMIVNALGPKDMIVNALGPQEDTVTAL